jgi:hypothetical protein
VENVLWAGWNPARAEQPQIAFSTGDSIGDLARLGGQQRSMAGQFALDPAPIRLNPDAVD